MSLSKTLPRNFQLRIDVPSCEFVVNDVMAKLETDQLQVFCPDDKFVFRERRNFLKRATLQVSIREWLPVGCQLIREVPSLDHTTHAVFRDNAAWCLFRNDGQLPTGPAALECEIWLSTQVLLRKRAIEPDCVKLIVAHELAHAFDLMRLAVPAVMNWEDFWKKPLAEGRNCGRALASIDQAALLLDDYGSESELTCLRQYWPSHAEKWIRAAQRLRAGRERIREMISFCGSHHPSDTRPTHQPCILDV